MINVSTQFEDAVKADVKVPLPSCLISWAKNYDDDVKFAQMDHSFMDGPDKMKGGGDTVTFFGKYDYINETSFVKNYRITKKLSGRPWGVIMATAEIELNNTTKRFFPGHDPSIGDFVALPSRPIKLGIGFKGEYIQLFTGYTEEPDTQLVKRVMKLRAFDAMTYLSTVKSNLGAFVNTTINEMIEALLIEQGFNPDQFNIEPSLQQPIGYYMPKGKYVTDIFKEFCQSEAYLLFSDEEGIIHGWNHLHLLGDRPPVWTFTYSNMEDIKWSTSSIINSAVTIAKPLKPAAPNKLFELSDASDQTLVPPGGSKVIEAEFKDDLGTFPAISVDAPVYVASAEGGSSYSTNMNKDGSGPTGSSNITLSAVENTGNKYLMTFENSGSFPIYITRIQLFGQPAKVTAVKGTEQYHDVSIGKYGVNPNNGGEVYKIENDLIQDTAMANTMAWLLVNTQGNAYAKLDIDNFVVPQMQIGDPVKVDILDTAESKYCNVFGLELFFGVGVALSQSTYVEERETKTYARMDQSLMDGPDHMAL